MALPMIYSRRKRIAENTTADVYQYVDMSPKLRQQILFVFSLWSKKFYDYTIGDVVFFTAVSDMRQELGKPSLCTYSNSPEDEFTQWFLACQEVKHLLDAIEFVVATSSRSSVRHTGGSFLLEEGIEEINARALEDGFGFQINDGQIIEIGSTFAHKNITVPALHLLRGSAFSEANKEFRQAYDEYNQGNYDDCIHDCCNSFESVLKVIFAEKKWAFDQNDTAKKLLATAFANNLIPSYMQNEFTGLRTILESGVPTVRNKEGGHGTGSTPRSIPKYIASFQLHQTAAAILLLIEAAR